jgi:hypothetical protein
MQPDEEAVYEFCVEMMWDHRVTDATFAKLQAQFTEQQIADLVAVTGFYATVSMILNTVEATIPTGEDPPLAPWLTAAVGDGCASPASPRAPPHVARSPPQCERAAVRCGAHHGESPLFQGVAMPKKPTWPTPP